jgi:cell division septation protein DedD
MPEKKVFKSGWHRRLLLMTLLIVLAGTIGTGWHLYQTGFMDFSKMAWTDWRSFVKPLGHRPATVTRAASLRSAVDPEGAPSSAVHFDFYTELPNSQVALPKASLSGPAKQAMVTPQKEQYVLQLGVFNNEAAAAQARVSLLLAGVEVDMVKNPEGYCLQQGPYIDLAQAKLARQRLETKGMTVLSVKKV